MSVLCFYKLVPSLPNGPLSQQTEMGSSKKVKINKQKKTKNQGKAKATLKCNVIWAPLPIYLRLKVWNLQ